MGSARNRRWRVLVAGIFALVGLLAFGAWGAVGSSVMAASRPSLRLLAPAAGHGKGASGVSARALRVVVGTRTSRSVLAVQQRRARPRSRSVHVGSGATVKRFEVSEPAGVIRLLRVTVPHGMRAKLTGAIPQVAGVAISTPQSTVPSETCQRRGAVDVCTQAEEACPMPAASWHFRLHKLVGLAGEIRLEFLVG